MINKKLLQLILAGLICFGTFVSAWAVQVSDSASSYLYEYAKELYHQGNMHDAVEQLHKALLANPNNLRAKKFLDRISPPELAEQPAGMPDQELVLLKAERLAMQAQYGQLKNGYLAKEGTLEKLTQDLQNSRKLLGEKENALRGAIKDKENKIGFLNREMGKLQQENSLYQQQLIELRMEFSVKDQELKKLSRELENQYGRSSSELTQKAEQLNKLKMEYEMRSKELESQVKAKELKIKALDNYKQSFWEEKKKVQSLQLSRIEKLMRDIEEVMPEVKNSASSKKLSPALTTEDKTQQVKRIDKLMRQIKEVVPEL